MTEDEEDDASAAVDLDYGQVFIFLNVKCLSAAERCVVSSFIVLTITVVPAVARCDGDDRRWCCRSIFRGDSATACIGVVKI